MGITRKLSKQITIHHGFTFGSSSLPCYTLSHLVYIVGTPSLILRPSVMVAPPFVPECITPKCLAHGNEGEATSMTTIGILPL
jgi:hypothetical protein